MSPRDAFEMGGKLALSKRAVVHTLLGGASFYFQRPRHFLKRIERPGYPGPSGNLNPVLESEPVKPLQDPFFKDLPNFGPIWNSS